MRALFEDLTHTTAFAGVELREVGLPMNTNRRDLWFRFFVSGSNIIARAYDTRANAKAGGVTGRQASATIVPSAVQQDVTMDDNVPNLPDMTGLKIKGVFSSVPGATGPVWGYVCAPDLVVCDNIVTRLKTYNSDGMALDGIADVDIFTGDETNAMRHPCIVVASLPAEIVLSQDTGSAFGVEYPIEVIVVVSSLDSPANLWRTCRQYQAAIESILHDECRTSYGELVNLYRVSSMGPGPVPGRELATMSAVVRLSARFHAVFRDDVYPRR